MNCCRLNILSIFITLFYFIVILFSRYSIGATPIFGTEFFKDTLLYYYKWSVNESNMVVVDSVKIVFSFKGDYPCSRAWDLSSIEGTFKSCILIRDFAGNNETKTYTSLKQLTNDELESFIERTGSIFPAKGGVQGFFSLTVTSTNGNSQTSYLPPPYSNAGIPPTEVKPPLKCSIANGVINHGSLSGSAVDQHSAKTTVSISCNGPATLSVRSEGYSPTKGLMINGPGTLYSKVNIGGVSAERGVQVRANNSTTVSVTSVLQGKGGVVAGAYSGSVVLVATII